MTSRPDSTLTHPSTTSSIASLSFFSLAVVRLIHYLMSESDGSDSGSRDTGSAQSGRSAERSVWHYPQACCAAAASIAAASSHSSSRVFATVDVDSLTRDQVQDVCDHSSG
jgi:hypothetical protein